MESVRIVMVGFAIQSSQILHQRRPKGSYDHGSMTTGLAHFFFVEIVAHAASAYFMMLYAYPDPITSMSAVCVVMRP